MVLTEATFPDDTAHRFCFHPPTPQTGICFHINSFISVKKQHQDAFEVQPQTVLVGPQITPVTINIGQNYKAIRLGFHPGGLYRLLGTDLGQLTDTSTNAEAVFGAEMRTINQQLNEADNDQALAKVIETFLLKKICSATIALPFDAAMMELVRQDGNLSMKAAADLSCLSLRQFQRQSHSRIGMSPKMFARIARFSKAYRLHEKLPQLTWTQIAHECGYSEQMQLIADVKKFAGSNPKKIEKAIALSAFKMQANLVL
nr:helix-turn-helix domain-containing protein [Niabella aurantiaca]